MCHFEISAGIRLNSVLIVACLRVFFGCLEQSFQEGISLSLIINNSHDWQSLHYLLVFRLFSGYTGERLILGLRRKDWILRPFFVVGSNKFLASESRF